MDGFDAFNDAPPAATEVDPAAEFLAKEQEDLGGLGEDLGFTSPPQEVHAPIVLENGSDEFEVLGGEPVIPVMQQSDEDIIQVTSMHAAPGDINPFSSAFEGSGMDAVTSGMGSMMREEPEVIKKWKAEQEEKLRVKDADEEKKMDELREQAKQELQDWYKHYEEQLEKTKETNRSAQETFVSEVNDIQPGTEWERVAKQCDFNAKTARNVKDVSRMRGILLQLKQNPPTRT